MSDTPMVRQLLRSGTAPLARFFDPRFHEVLVRLDGLPARLDRIEAAVAPEDDVAYKDALGERLARLEDRVDAAIAAANSAAGWSHEIVGAMQALSLQAPTSHGAAELPGDSGLEAVIDAYVAQRLAHLPAGATVAVLGGAAASRRGRTLSALGYTAVSGEDASSATEVAAIVCDRPQSLRDRGPIGASGTVVVVAGGASEGAATDDPLGVAASMSIEDQRLLTSSGATDGVWIALSTTDAGDELRQNVVVLVSGSLA